MGCAKKDSIVYIESMSHAEIKDNVLIHSENLLALQNLEKEYTEKIKCIYIDPPYNTKQNFTHYDDSLEHSLWLNMMKERLVIMHRLLRDDGSIWISIDDRECHYLKVLCDEIFGRNNFIANVVWERTQNTKTDTANLSCSHDHLLVYFKNQSCHFLNKIKRTKEQMKNYRNVDSNGNRYALISLKKTGPNSKREDRPNLFFNLKAPDGSIITPLLSNGRDGRWRWSKEKVNKDWHLIEWKKTKSGWTVYYRIYEQNNLYQPGKTLWTSNETGSNSEAKKEVKTLNPNDVFPTPKPERLIQRIIHLSTNPGDLVLDSFAGSGTTGAVAHKMSRRWIMIEMEDTVHTHIIPRLEKVISGEDQGGISKAVNWKGGGGFCLKPLP